MKNRFLLTITGLLILCLALSGAQASEWTQVKNENGVILSQRSLPGKAYQQLRGTVLMPGKIDALMAILDNPGFCVQWLHDCRTSRTVKRINTAERIDYTVMDAPFMLDDRDMYIHSKASYDSQSRTATIQLRGMENYDTGQPRRVRVLGLQGHWRFQQLDETQVRIEYLIYLDPQVKPASLYDAMSADLAFKTLDKLRKLAGSARFRDVKFDPVRLKAITVR